ncbi:hypothetical protein QVD17_11644 [Tagetes erecta]|uniref:Increased DNA methylation 1 C-terminal domain-containing protein n=1 Tax=Tagetes erecta TaxID=13708 RepID=A0AAD8NV58_TARER|nr:hypothetical protein QVD17_11644 [Tagetes erecta]
MPMVSQFTNVDVQCNGRDAFEEKNPLVTQVVDMFHGFFQVFLLCFERLLSNLKIKKLVIPAAGDAIPMWTNKFGFKKLPPKMVVFNQHSDVGPSVEEQTLIFLEVHDRVSQKWGASTYVRL